MNSNLSKAYCVRDIRFCVFSTFVICMTMLSSAYSELGESNPQNNVHTSSGDNRAEHKAITPEIMRKSFRNRVATQFGGNRKIHLNPRKIKNGINSGGVIVYGHYMKPPYALEISDGKLLINGIQVAPTTVPMDQERKKRVEVVKTTRTADGYNEIKEILEAKWYSEKSTKDREVLKNEVLDVLLKRQEVSSGSWTGDTSLTFKFKGNVVAYGIFFYEEKNNKPLQKNPAKVLIGLKNRYEKDLSDNHVIVVTSDSNVLTKLSKESFLSKINTIMSDSSLAKDEKMSAIEKETDYSAALDIYGNYAADEWK